MIENVVRVVSGKRAKGEAVDDATILGACREVARPVVFSVGIITLVYLPVLGLSGVEGRMFRPMALTVVFALLGSLILAVMAMPVLASLVLKESDEKHTWLMRTLSRAYTPVLGRTLRSPALSLGLALGVFALSLALIPRLGAEFTPKLNEGSIAVQIIRPPSVSLSESLAQATAVERALLAGFPDEVETVISRTGTAEIATDPMGVDFSDVYVMLKPSSGWQAAEDQAGLVEVMEQTLSSSVPGVNFAFSQPIELRVNELLETDVLLLSVRLLMDRMALLRTNAVHEANLSDQLLNSILPSEIASQLKAAPSGMSFLYLRRSLCMTCCQLPQSSQEILKRTVRDGGKPGVKW